MKEYEIKNISVIHPELGELSKTIIIYYVDGEEELKEHFTGEIKPGYNQKQ